MAEDLTIRPCNPNRSKYFPLLQIMQTSSGAHTDSLLFNLHRVSSLEIKRPERDFDHFAPGSANFNLVELRLCSQYMPLSLGHRQLRVFTLPVSSKFTFDQRNWSGLIEIVGCSRKQRTSWRANRCSVRREMSRCYEKTTNIPFTEPKFVYFALKNQQLILVMN